MQFLIDGYNLMHAAGYLTSKASGRLEPIRNRFLDWLAGIAKTKAVGMRIVFDGQDSNRKSKETEYRGVRVRFSSSQTADDDIESILKSAGAGIVVSNDSRLHEAARRANAEAWRCERFLDWVIAKESSTVLVPVISEKPSTVGDEAELLAAFQQPRGRGR